MGRKSEFSREEKIAAVKLVTEGGRSVLSVANEYGIHENTLGKWKRQYAINPEGAFRGEPVLEEADAQARELQQLKRRVCYCFSTFQAVPLSWQHWKTLRRCTYACSFQSLHLAHHWSGSEQC